MKIRALDIFVKTLLLSSTGAIGLSSLTLPARAISIVESDLPGGDFSNSRLTPTSLGTLDPGNNSVRFVLNNPTPIGTTLNRDLDYFTLSIPTGFLFTNLVITEYTPEIAGGIIGTDQIAFIALQSGTVFTEPPQPTDPATGLPVVTNPANLLGYTLIGSNLAASSLPPGTVDAPFDDLLPTLGATVNRPNQPNGNPSPAPAGFVAPLSAGDYVFWVQQTASGAATIGLNFVVSPIPEPTSALAIVGVGALGLALRRKSE